MLEATCLTQLLSCVGLLPEPDGEEEHENDRYPDEGGQEEQEQDGSAGQNQGLRNTDDKCYT